MQVWIAVHLRSRHQYATGSGAWSCVEVPVFSLQYDRPWHINLHNHGIAMNVEWCIAVQRPGFECQSARLAARFSSDDASHVFMFKNIFEKQTASSLEWAFVRKMGYSLLARTTLLPLTAWKVADARPTSYCRRTFRSPPREQFQWPNVRTEAADAVLSDQI